MNLEPAQNAAAATGHALAWLLPSGDIWSASNSGGLLMPALAGVAAAFTVALIMTLYFQTRYRGYRAMIRHALVAAIALSLLAVMIFDLRNAAIAHIANTSTAPTAEFQQQWKATTARAKAIAAEMGHVISSSPEADQG